MTTQVSRFLLRILDGVHHGASIALDAKHRWTIGSAMDADVLLVDEGVAERHAQIELAGDGQTITLTALDEGVTVFGKPLAAAAAISLRAGSAWAIGPVNMCLALAPDAHAADEAISDEAAETAAARRHALKQLDRRAYLLSLARTPWLARAAKFAVPAVLGLGALAWLALGSGKPTVEDHARALDHIRARFPDVAIDDSQSTGVTTYTGYVDAHAQLGELRTLALAADQGRTVMHVVPMEALQWNALQILDELYVNPEVTVRGAGSLDVALSGPAAVKSLQGWDFKAVEEKLRHELPELRRVRIHLEAPRDERVAVGWSRGPYSVVSTQEDTYFAITESGERIFGGAKSAEGVVRDIYRCGMVVDPERGTHFVFDFSQKSGGDGCGK